MAIATLIITAAIYKSSGASAEGMVSSIAVGTIICIIAAMAGDTSQDLKTGYIVGATPKKQQYGELISVVVSSMAIEEFSICSMQPGDMARQNFRLRRRP